MSDNDLFNNELRRTKVKQYFDSVSDDEFLSKMENSLFEPAYQKLRIEPPHFPGNPRPPRIRPAASIDARDSVEFDYVVTGNHKPYRIRYNDIKGPFPPHTMNDNVITFSYPVGDAKAVREQHVRDVEIMRRYIEEADRAVASYNSMLETEIRALIADGKQRAEKRRKFLQDLSSEARDT